MKYRTALLFIATLFAISAIADTVADDTLMMNVNPVNKWRGATGRIMDNGAVQGPESLRYVDGECILSESALKSLWKFWEIKDEMPKINFKKEFAVIALTHGIPVLAKVPVLDNGNLIIEYVQKPVWEPKPYYLLISFNHNGIRLVNGQPLGGELDVQPAPAPDASRR